MKSELNFAKPISGERRMREFAARYVWWKTPDEVLLYPQRIAAQVMNRGDFEDARMLAHEIGDDFLRQVLMCAEVGQFNPRSWYYWHYCLGLADVGSVPALPSRKLPGENSKPSERFSPTHSALSGLCYAANPV